MALVTKTRMVRMTDLETGRKYMGREEYQEDEAVEATRRAANDAWRLEMGFDIPKYGAREIRQALTAQELRAVIQQARTDDDVAEFLTYVQTMGSHLVRGDDADFATMVAGIDAAIPAHSFDGLKALLTPE